MSSTFSETRFREIDTIAGSGPTEYMKRLAAETDKDGSLDAYLSWSFQRPISTKVVEHAPKDVLGRLFNTSYSNEEAIMILVTDLKFSVSGNIEVAKNATDLFVVAADPAAAAPVYEQPQTIPTTDEQASDLPVHPGFLTTVVAPSGVPSAATAGESAAAATPLQLPKLILPIGRLLYKDLRPIDKLGDTGLDRSLNERDFEDTNYVVAADALSPDHSIWIIFNRQRLDDDSGDRVPVNPTVARIVFPDLRANPDAMQLFAKAKDWFDQYGSIDLDRIKRLMSGTIITGAVAFGVAKTEDVAKAFNGTRPAPPAA